MSLVKIGELNDKVTLPDTVVDFSMLNTFLTCPRKFYHRHLEHLDRPNSAPPLVFGGALHESLDLLYTTMAGGDLPTIEELQIRFIEYAEDKLPILSSDYNFRSLERGCEILEDYYNIYAHKDKVEFRVKHVEIPFYYILDPNLGFVGRIDTVVEWMGQHYIMDHKTTTNLSSKYFDMYRPNHQVSAYLMVYEAITGVKPAGFIVNAIASKKFKTKSVSDHFMRSITSRTHFELSEFEDQILWLAHEVDWRKKMLDKVDPDVIFYQNTGGCHNYNSPCAFIDLCEVAKPLRAAIKRTRYVVNEWKPYDY